jgi:hypothetical protein
MTLPGPPTLTSPRRAGNLPPVASPAWHGPLGEAARAIAPVTEADPVAILTTLLALFGALSGDGPHVRVGGVRHPARVWPLVIGKTGSGRKGTSFAEARTITRRWSEYAETYTRRRIVSGLSSGEGLISALGAGMTTPDDPKQAAAEPVAPDGRLAVIEPEFARVLAASKRDGSTLGPVLRQLWDDGAAAILTRAAPLQVDGAHLTVIAHVTPRELRLRLAESDLSGGTLNRFLLVASERPQLLAHELEHPDLSEQARWLGKAVDAARASRHELRRDRAADKMWTEVYGALCADEPDGQLGSVLARGPAYTMRLALTYALADGAGSISPTHLMAGLAVWQYSAATARRLFTDERTRSDLEKLGAFIAGAAAGRTRTEVHAYFGRNRPADELDTLLHELERAGAITVGVDEASVGRPAARYTWTGQPRDRMGQLLQRYERNESTKEVGTSGR